ncbi:hypothetical protein QW131_28910 [Roseibium salinum]|nr:hypothetical protein [Roseibium salinum]
MLKEDCRASGIQRDVDRVMCATAVMTAMVFVASHLASASISLLAVPGNCVSHRLPGFSRKEISDLTLFSQRAELRQF